MFIFHLEVCEGLYIDKGVDVLQEWKTNLLKHGAVEDTLLQALAGYSMWLEWAMKPKTQYRAGSFQYPVEI